MSSIQQHCRECKKEMGTPWMKVHEWLDEFAKEQGAPKHRRMRHHKEGVEEVRDMWGDEAAKAAEIHIRRDLFFYGNDIPSKDEYDKVEEAYFGAKCDMFGTTKRDGVL